MTRCIRSACGLMFAIFFGTAIPSYSQTSIESVVITGDMAPDGDGIFGPFDGSFSLPVINNSSEVAFRGSLVNSTASTGIFRGSRSTLIQIARAGDPAPLRSGTNDGTLRLDSPFPALNDSGQVAFSASVNRSSINSSSGLFLGDGNSLAATVREGDFIPIPVGNFGSFSAPFLNNNGKVGFSSFLRNTGSNFTRSGLFRTNFDNSLVQVFREGQSSTGGNATVRDVEGASGINSLGQIAVRADVGNQTGSSLFRGDGTALIPIARVGDGAPNGAGGFNGTFNDIRSQSLNDRGQVAFFADIFVSNDDGIFVGDGSTVTQIVRDGQAAPDGSGSPSGFFRNLGSASLNNTGQVLFFGAIGVINSSLDDLSSLFLGDGTSLTQIAREGELTPSGLGTFEEFGAFILNDLGQVAFLADIDLGNGGTGFDSIGLYVYDEQTGLQEIIRQGDPLFGNTVSALGIASDVFRGGAHTSFNNLGELAFRFELSDTRGGIAIAFTTVVDDVLLGDVDQNGVLNFSDIPPFIAVLSSGVFQPEADCNEDGSVNFSDIPAFIAILIGQ